MGTRIALTVFGLLCLVGCHAAGRGEDAGEGSAGSTAPCIETQLCVRGDHWDNQACRCVPDAADGGTCVQNVLCVRTAHFDPELCRCVPNDP